MRGGGNLKILDTVQEKIEMGLLDFLEEKYCVSHIGIFFKRFMQSLVEKIIPDKIAKIMRFTESKHM